MAWTAPRTYTTNELITAAILNLDHRDNLLFLGSTHAHAGAAGDGATISGIPANVIAYFNGAVASIPSGWTEFTAARGRVIVGVPSGGTVGGTVGTALTNLQDLTHTHTGPSHQHLLPISTDASAVLGINQLYGTSGTLAGAPEGGIAGTGTKAKLLTEATGTGATGATSATTPYIQQPTIVKS